MDTNPLADMLGDMAGGHKGQFDEYMNHLSALANGALASYKERITQCHFADPLDRLYVTRLIECGEYQMLSEAGMRAIILRHARGRLRNLTRALRHWDDLSDDEATLVPLTKSGVRAEIDGLEKRIARLQEAEEKALANGSKWDATPLLEFLGRPEEERRNMSCTHHLPPELRVAETFMISNIDPRAPWFGHMQAIAAQALTGAALGIGKNISLADYAAMQDVGGGRRGNRRFRRQGAMGE